MRVPGRREESRQYGPRSSAEVRGRLLANAREFVEQVSLLAGVERIALLGSLATAKPFPKDIVPRPNLPLARMLAPRRLRRAELWATTSSARRPGRRNLAGSVTAGTAGRALARGRDALSRSVGCQIGVTHAAGEFGTIKQIMND